MRWRLPSLSLQSTLALACSAAVLLLVLLLAAVGMRLLEADLRSNAEAGLAAIVEATAADVDEKVAQRLQVITAAAAALPAELIADEAALQAHFASRPVMRSFFDLTRVLDAQGRVVLNTPDVTGAIGQSLADRPHVRHVLATGEAVVSEPLAGRTTHQPTVVFAAPLRDAAGQVQGVLTGAIMLTRANFLGSLANHRIGRNGYFYIATKGERAVLAVHPQKHRIMEPVPDAGRNPHLQRALAGFEGTVEGRNSQGLHALHTYRSLRSVPWVVAGVYPVAEAFAPIEQRRRQLTTAAFAVAAFAGVLIVLLCSGLMRPLRHLHRRMVDATNGRGEHLVTVRSRASDIGDIVRAYNALMLHKDAAEKLLHDSERQLRAIADNLPVLIAYIDRELVYRFVNATYGEWFGKPVAQIGGRPVQALVGTEGLAARTALFERALRGERVDFSEQLTLPHRTRHVQGTYIPDRGEDGEVQGFHVLIADVTEAKDNEQRLIALARRDALTGLPNRRHFQERLDEAMARARRQDRPIALMVLDIDHFKQINDRHGHGGGDAVLKVFAERLLASVRVTDMVSRLAGDEFTIILEGLGLPEQALIVARKIIAAMDTPVALPEGPVRLSTSIGITGYDAEPISSAELFDRADAALYEAKRAGRGRFHFAPQAATTPGS